MQVVGLVVGALLIVVGAMVGVGATRRRRRRWREAWPFAGGERAAPEPVLVPPSTVFLVYTGWLLVTAGAATATVAST